jgi:glycosyltransferase involved in cell wall biosynthesis
MRITILQGAFLPVPPLRGGAVEKLWFELGKQFTMRGHSVCHISRSYPGLPPEELIEGVQHLRVRGHDMPSNGIHLKLLDLLYSWRALRVLPPADILITNTFWMPMLASRRQHRFGRIMVSVERMPKGQMRLYGRAAWLRAPSRAVAQAIRREAPRLSNRIRTIPNPLPFQPSLLVAEELSPVILYCGRLHPEKGIGLLIEAFAQACERGLSGWSLRLVGAADTAAGGGGVVWLEGLLSAPRAAGLPIEWLGPIYDDQQLQLQYQRAAVFVYPSLAEEGETFGLAPLEAMACGAVPIVSDLACFRDFITPGLNGLVFNHRAANPASLLADTMIELADHPAHRASLRKQALAVLESHRPAVIAEEFLRCFGACFNNSSSSDSSL